MPSSTPSASGSAPPESEVPGAARNHLDALVVAIAQYLGDLLGGLRQHHHHGQLPVGGKPIAVIGPHSRLGCDHTLAGTIVRNAATMRSRRCRTAASGSGIRNDIL